MGKTCRAPAARRAAARTVGGLRNGRAALLARANLIKLVPLGLGLLAGMIIWVATPWGLGIEYDSVFYWSAAENLLGGRGLGRLNGAGQFIPLTQFPPLYPLFMAAVAVVCILGRGLVKSIIWVGARALV